jgi:hypothetical protein
MTEHEENLRDLAAMFALCGLMSKNGFYETAAKDAYEQADMMMDARKPVEEAGIVAIKKRKKAS